MESITKHLLLSSYTGHEPIIASQGFHVYKETTWSNEKAGDEVKVEIESSLKLIAIILKSLLIKAKHEYFIGLKTFGYIPREISRYVCIFIKQEGGRVYG